MRVDAEAPPEGGGGYALLLYRVRCMANELMRYIQPKKKKKRSIIHSEFKAGRGNVSSGNKSTNTQFRKKKTPHTIGRERHF